MGSTDAGQGTKGEMTKTWLDRHWKELTLMAVAIAGVAFILWAAVLWTVLLGPSIAFRRVQVGDTEAVVRSKMGSPTRVVAVDAQANPLWRMDAPPMDTVFEYWRIPGERQVYFSEGRVVGKAQW